MGKIKVVPNARIWAQIFSKLFRLVADTLNINSVIFFMISKYLQGYRK